MNRINQAIKAHEKKYHTTSIEATWQPKVGDEVWWDWHTSFKHLSPLKVNPKPDPATKVTVYTFDADAKMEEYHFYGKPDFERIERENIIEGGKEAVIVERKKNFNICNAIAITKTSLIENWKDWDYPKIHFKISSGEWFWSNDINIHISEIRAAILKAKPEPKIPPKPDPKHHNGEPFLGVNDSPDWLLKNEMLVYTGEYERVNDPNIIKWYVKEDGRAWYGWSFECKAKRPILKAVPRPKEGEICDLPPQKSDGENRRFVYTGNYENPSNKWAVSDNNEILFFAGALWNNTYRWTLMEIPAPKPDPGKRLNELREREVKLNAELNAVLNEMLKIERDSNE
jgi:hypothetical protein